jgi:hypothetical protein
MTDRAFRAAALLAYLLGTVVLTSMVLLACEGHFIYTLDDPYIHLALAENIARGTYGINLQEYSSPSSSILFPFLLAPFALLGIERFVPFLLGLLSNAASVWIMAGFFHRHAIAGGSGERSWAWVLLVPLLLVSVNAVALPFVGMEHPLHLLSVVLTVIGLVRLGETERMNVPLAAGVLMAPMLRFEGLALSGAVLLILLLTGRARTALGLSAVLSLALASYALFMHLHGLPLIPSSVMVKSAVSANAVDHGALAVVTGLTQNLTEAIKLRQGTLLAVACMLLLPVLHGMRLGRDAMGDASKARALLAFAAILAMAAHLLLGTYGWFGRYEVYVFGLMLLAVTYVLSDAIRRVDPVWLRIAACALGLTLMGFSFWKSTWNTPAAARNVYEQQWQMHRFVVGFFPHPVAVNDIGAVSYGNDRFVLDLWGLGSEEARKLRTSGHFDAAGIGALVQRHHVPLAIVYDSWFRNAVPSDWQPMARLTTSKVMSGDTTVTFYLTRPAYKRELLSALRRFATTLPAGTKLQVAEQSPPIAR